MGGGRWEVRLSGPHSDREGGELKRVVLRDHVSPFFHLTSFSLDVALLLLSAPLHNTIEPVLWDPTRFSLRVGPLAPIDLFRVSETFFFFF